MTSVQHQDTGLEIEVNSRQREKSSRQPAVTPVTVLMLLTNSYDPDPRVRQEALSLRAMGYHVRLLAWDRDGKSPTAEMMEGIQVERVHLPSSHGRGTTQIFFYLAVYLKLIVQAWRISFDIIHCHDLDTLPLGFLVGRLKRKPVVYDAHENFVGMLAGNVHPWVCRALTWIEDSLIARVDLLITVGEKLRQSFVARGARRTAVVGNWKSLKDYQRTEEQNQELRRKLGVPGNALVITCITQLLKNRMIGELVEAARAFPEVYVVLAGKGAMEEQVRKWAAQEPRIIYPGFLHASEVPAYTCASDVIYCGFDLTNPNAAFAAPNKLFEALAAGKPLITPDVGEIGDLVRRANCGEVLPEMSVSALREAINLARDPYIRAVWTRNAQDLGRREMNWDKGHAVLKEEYAHLHPKGKLSEPETSGHDQADLTAREQSWSDDRLTSRCEKS